MALRGEDKVAEEKRGVQVPSKDPCRKPAACWDSLYFETQLADSQLVWHRRRLELIQDLEFPEAAHRLKASADGNYLYASGIHPPRVSVMSRTAQGRSGAVQLMPG